MIMMHPFRKSLLLLCCFLVPAVMSVYAQEEAPNDKPGRSTIRGRVIFSDSEQPLRRATLLLLKEFNHGFLKRTVSGKRGEFSFQGVPAGTYYIDVDAPGVINQRQRFSFTDVGFSVADAGLTLVTVDGVNDMKTEVRAARGAVISGRISYVDGEPATRAQLVLYRQKGQSFELFASLSPTFTDDRGVYRIEGLPPGQYVVGAIENHSAGRNQFPRDLSGFITAFHPAASTVNAATVVSLQTASETRDVNIKFAEEPRRLSGTLKWKQNNAAIKGAIVVLRRVGDPQVDVDLGRFLAAITSPGDLKNDGLAFRDMAFFSLASTNAPYSETDQNGRWSFDGLSAGTYVVSVEAPLSGTKDASPDLTEGAIRGSAEVKIEDKDVENLVIELTPGARIIGSVVIEGSAVPKNSVRVRVNANGPQTLLTPAALVKADGSFVLESVPAGAVRLDILEWNGASNYYIRSMTGKGLDLRNESLVVTEGEQVTGVQIVLGADMATVEGRVVSASGNVAGAGVVLLPADQRQWNTRSLWGMARADSEGRFSLRLAPGDYVALAWSLSNEPTAPFDTYVRTRLSSTQRITLTPNETKTIELPATREP